MAKKKAVEQQRIKIVCPDYQGYLDDMPKELKDARQAQKAKLFENKEQ